MPGATPLRESACRVSKTEGFLRFLRFFLVGCTPLRESGCRVIKTEGFLRFFFGRVHPSQGKQLKLVFFCVFGGPKTVLKTVLTIRFALYGRFFERGKMSENRQKTLKIVGFWRFFRVRSNPLRESGCQVSKIGFFLRFFFGRVHPSQAVLTICFALYGLFFLRLPNGQYGPVSQLSWSEKCCTGPFNWGEAHCAGEKVKRKIGPFQRKSL